MSMATQVALVVATALIFLVRLTFALYQSRVDARTAEAHRRADHVVAKGR
jgi:hypothetical protein